MLAAGLVALVTIGGAGAASAEPAPPYPWSPLYPPPPTFAVECIGPPVNSTGPGAKPVPYVAVTPARLVDTRIGLTTVDGQLAGQGALGAGAALTVPITGRAGVPASGVTAVALNVTAVNHTARTFITVYPSGTARPTVSSLNPLPQITSTNSVVARVGSNGSVDIYNAIGATDLIVDVQGYFVEGAGVTALDPARVVDTRPGESTIDGQAAGTGSVGPTGTLTVHLAGRAGVPAAGVDSVVLSVTAVNHTRRTFLTVFPADQARPLASNLNPQPGVIATNLVITKLSQAGDVSIFNNDGSTDVIVDVFGWVASDSAFTAITPSRLFDSRPNGQRYGGRIGGGGSVTLDVTRGPTPPSNVTAVVLNVTAVDSSMWTYLSVYPTDPAASRPLSSNLNPQPGLAASNTVIAGVGDDGTVTVFNNSGATNVVVDIVGYFTNGHPAVAVPDCMPWGSGRSLPVTGDDRPVREVQVVQVTGDLQKVGSAPFSMRLADASQEPFLVAVIVGYEEVDDEGRWYPIPWEIYTVGPYPRDLRMYIELDYTEFASRIANWPRSEPDYIVGDVITLTDLSRTESGIETRSGTRGPRSFGATPLTPVR